MFQESRGVIPGWEEFSAALASPETECPPEFKDSHDAVTYLRGVLGEDYLDEAWKISKHPFLSMMAISWPGLRSQFLDWIAHLRRVDECSNVDKVLNDLRIPNKCRHAYTMIEIGGRLRRRGFDVLFEPQVSGGEFPFRPDALVVFGSTAESFFLELSCQDLAHSQLSAFEAMDACHRPVRKYLGQVKCSFSLRTIPAPEHMEEIVRKIEKAVEAVIATGHLVEVIEEETLEMGICKRDNSVELDMWCNARGLHSNGFEGPRDDTNEIERLKEKIKREQRQLPVGHANILILENDHIFTHHLNILGLISALQEEVYKYGNIGSVWIRGSNGSNRGEVAEEIEHGEHRFQRCVRQGHIRHTLLLSNRYAEQKPSDKQRKLVCEALFD